MKLKEVVRKNCFIFVLVGVCLSLCIAFYLLISILNYFRVREIKSKYSEIVTSGEKLYSIPEQIPSEVKRVIPMDWDISDSIYYKEAVRTETFSRQETAESEWEQITEDKEVGILALEYNLNLSPGQIKNEYKKLLYENHWLFSDHYSVFSSNLLYYFDTMTHVMLNEKISTTNVNFNDEYFVDLDYYLDMVVEKKGSGSKVIQYFEYELNGPMDCSRENFVSIVRQEENLDELLIEDTTITEEGGKIFLFDKDKTCRHIVFSTREGEITSYEVDQDNLLIYVSLKDSKGHTSALTVDLLSKEVYSTYPKF